MAKKERSVLTDLFLFLLLWPGSVILILGATSFTSLFSSPGLPDLATVTSLLDKKEDELTALVGEVRQLPLHERGNLTLEVTWTGDGRRLEVIHTGQGSQSWSEAGFPTEAEGEILRGMDTFRVTQLCWEKQERGDSVEIVLIPPQRDGDSCSLVHGRGDVVSPGKHLRDTSDGHWSVVASYDL